MKVVFATATDGIAPNAIDDFDAIRTAAPTKSERAHFFAVKIRNDFNGFVYVFDGHGAGNLLIATIIR